MGWVSHRAGQGENMDDRVEGAQEACNPPAFTTGKQRPLNDCLRPPSANLLDPALHSRYKVLGLLLPKQRLSLQLEGLLGKKVEESSHIWAWDSCATEADRMHLEGLLFHFLFHRPVAWVL